MLNSLFAAFSMYSRIPVPKIKWDKKNMKYVLFFFPMVGVVIGAVVFIMGSFLADRTGKLLFGCVMSAIPVFITGGIHLDGFLDTMDGIYSYASKEKRAEILKDPCCGAFAVIGGIVYFMLSVGFWSELTMLFPVCIGYCISRTLSALSVVSFNIAENSGLLTLFECNDDKGKIKTLLVVWLVAETAVLSVFGIKYLIIIVIAAGICYLYHYHNCKNNFNGITGDLAGFFLQICELAILGGCVLFNGGEVNI